MAACSMLIYSFYFFTILQHRETTKYRYAATKKLSQTTGMIMNMPLPPYMRIYLFKAYGMFYGVNFKEIKNDLNSFRTFN